jgi:hypothetical protein
MPDLDAMNSGHAEWLLSLTPAERRAHTEAARAELKRKLEERANPDGDLPPEEVAFRLKQLRRLLTAQAGRRSGEVRRAKSEERKRAANAAELDELAGIALTQAKSS